MYYYDNHGWLTSQPIEGRSTDVAPPQETETLKANWTGVDWVLVEYTAPPAPPAPVEDERLWWMDPGPFKDRLGADGPAIYASTHDACKGVVGLLQDRKYVSLKDPKVSGMLDVLIATSQPAVNPVWPGSGPMTPAKKTAILNTMPTEYERHIKGL